jgi:DNA polymerase (family 10)
MNRKKALEIFEELRAKCPGLILSGSVLRGKEDNIKDLDLIWVGKVFPAHLLPVGDMSPSTIAVSGKDILRFTYKGEGVDIYRTEKERLGAMKLHLTGPREYSICTRSIAKRKGMKLNQYGLFKGDVCVASKTEQDILEALNTKWLEPVERNRFKSIRLK